MSQGISLSKGSCFLEGPDPDFWRKARRPYRPGNPTFGEELKNLSFLTAVYSKIPRPRGARGLAFMEGKGSSQCLARA